MTTAELKEYLAMVVQTEKEVNLQEQLWQQLNYKEKIADNEIDQIKKSIERSMDNVKAPEMPQIAAPKRGTENAEQAKFKIFMGPVFTIATIFIIYLLTNLDLYMGLASSLLCLLALACIAGSLYFVPASIHALLSYSNEEKKDSQNYLAALGKYQAVQNKYESELAEYKKAQQTIQAENANRLKKIEQLKVEKQVAIASRQDVSLHLTSSRQNLEKMYSYNVVFPKYRNYVMVSSLYEYLCAGRCTTLEGHEGAYNILELEIRLDRIITRLDDILRNLAAIQANQYTLYSCLQDSNRKIDKLLQEENRIADSLESFGGQLEYHASLFNSRLADLQKSSELTNYLTECNQRELHYMNRMNYLAGHYDNPYGNYSPV